MPEHKFWGPSDTFHKNNIPPTILFLSFIVEHSVSNLNSFSINFLQIFLPYIIILLNGHFNQDFYLFNVFCFVNIITNNCYLYFNKTIYIIQILILLTLTKSQIIKIHFYVSRCRLYSPSNMALKIGSLLKRLRNVNQINKRLTSQFYPIDEYIFGLTYEQIQVSTNTCKTW